MYRFYPDFDHIVAALPGWLSFNRLEGGTGTCIWQPGGGSERQARLEQKTSLLVGTADLK